MKLIHFDEAGTSYSENIAVVAGVIVDADRQFRMVEESIAAATERHIPEAIRDGFIFHAKDVFGKWKKKFNWDIRKCNEITEAWVAIIREHNLPVSVTHFPKSRHFVDVAGLRHNPKANKKFGNDFAHMMAFALNFQQCDNFMAEFYPDEVASVLIEDCPEMRGYLRDMAESVKKGELKEIVPNYFGRGQVTHIKNAIQFHEKKDATLLQLADVSAFIYKRYVNRNKGGERLFNVLLGLHPASVLAEPVRLAGGRIIWHRRRSQTA